MKLETKLNKSTLLENTLAKEIYYLFGEINDIKENMRLYSYSEEEKNEERKRLKELRADLKELNNIYALIYGFKLSE